MLLQRLQPITSPGTHPSPQGLPSARAPSRPPRFYGVPDEHDSINVAREATPEQMRGDKELREEQGDTGRSSWAGGHGRTAAARGKVGLSCLCLRGDGEGYREERICRNGILRKLFPPYHWKDKLEAKPWVLLGYSVTKCFVYTSPRAHITLLGLGGCPQAPPGDLCPKQLQEWAPSAGGNKDSAKCGGLQVSATTCKSPTCGP